MFHTEAIWLIWCLWGLIDCYVMSLLLKYSLLFVFLCHAVTFDHEIWLDYYRPICWLFWQYTATKVQKYRVLFLTISNMNVTVTLFISMCLLEWLLKHVVMVIICASELTDTATGVMVQSVDKDAVSPIVVIVVYCNCDDCILTTCT